MKTITLKMKLITYSAASIGGLILGMLIASLMGQGLVLSLCWGVFGAAICAVVSRVVLHSVMEDYSAEMWQISIYFLVSCFGWMGAIMSESWSGFSIAMAVVVAGAMMAIGNRFIRTVDQKTLHLTISALASETLEDIKPSPSGEVMPTSDDEDLEALKATQKFRFIGDNAGNANDESRAVCDVNGLACTVKEAWARGRGAIAAEGIEYLKKALAAYREEPVKEE